MYNFQKTDSNQRPSSFREGGVSMSDRYCTGLCQMMKSEKSIYVCPNQECVAHPYYKNEKQSDKNEQTVTVMDIRCVGC